MSDSNQWEKALIQIRAVARKKNQAQRDLASAQRDLRTLFQEALAKNPADVMSQDYHKNQELLSEAMKGD